MDNTIKTQMLEKYKEEFCELLRSTEREGIENLVSWLENETDFFHRARQHQAPRLLRGRPAHS